MNECHGDRRGGLPATAATNFEGSVSLTRALLPQMLERRDGHVVVVSTCRPGSPTVELRARRLRFSRIRRAARRGRQSRRARDHRRARYIATEHAASAKAATASLTRMHWGVPPEELLQKSPTPSRREAAADLRAVNARVAVWLPRWPAALFRYMASKA